MKKQNRFLTLAILLTLIGGSTLPLLYNPLDASTRTMKTMYVRITRVSITDELDGGSYNFYIGVKWQRIYGDYGQEFKEDEDYENGIGSFWNCEYKDYITDWSMIGGEEDDWYQIINTENCYTPDISTSGYQLWLYCKLDKKWAGSSQIAIQIGGSETYSQSYPKLFDFVSYGGDIVVYYQIRLS